MGSLDGEKAGEIAEMVRMGAASCDSWKRVDAVLETLLSGCLARSQMRHMMRKRDIVFIIVGGAMADVVVHENDSSRQINLQRFGVSEVMESKSVGGGTEPGEQSPKQSVQLGRGLADLAFGRGAEICRPQASDCLFEQLVRASRSRRFGGGGKVAGMVGENTELKSERARIGVVHEEQIEHTADLRARVITAAIGHH